MAAQPILPPEGQDRPQLQLVTAAQPEFRPKSSFRPYFWWLLVFVGAIVLAWLVAASPRTRAEQQAPAATYSSGTSTDVRGLARI